MSIFKETKKIFAYSGLGTDQFIQIVGTNIPRVFIRLCVVLLPMLCCVVDGVVCIKLISYRLVDGLKPFGVMVSFLPVTPIYFSLMMKTNEINDLLDYLQKVINTRTASESLTIYRTSNTNTNKMIERVFSSAYKGMAIIHVVPALCALLYLATGHPSPNLWMTPCSIEKLSPFFTKYPLGFIIAVAIDTIFAAIFIVAFKAFTTIYVVISTNIEAIANDISTSVARLNANIAHAKISHELKEIVKLHLHTYRLIEMLEYIIRAPIFYQIAVFAMQLAIFLCLIEANIDDLSFNLLSFVCGLLVVSILNYMLCYFVTNVTFNAMSICDRIYELNWFQLSRHDQIMVQMMIRRAQRQFELRGLSIIVCSLETFLKMLRTALSYYMIFRRL